MAHDGYTNPLDLHTDSTLPQHRVRSGRASPTASQGGLLPTGGLHVSTPSATVLAGRQPKGPDDRKFRYDVLASKEKRLAFVATRDDRMSPSEAGQKLEELHTKMGLTGEPAEVVGAFDAGLFFTHAINGASVLTPGRATWHVPGHTVEFSYKDVIDILGVDLRRFFRAFADDIAAVNKAVLNDYDPSDHVLSEQRGWLMEVATKRGLMRYPHLAHDSADACTDLSIIERQALIMSKRLVISNTVNSADSMRDTPNVMSADNFDSTNMRVVGQSNSYSA